MSASSQPTFAALCVDVRHSAEARARVRAAHLQWIKSHAVDTLFAGALRQHEHDAHVVGSLIVLRAADAAHAHSVLQQDPYRTEGVFDSVLLKPWRCAMSSLPLPPRVFVVWCQDRRHSLALRARTRPQHLQWWTHAGRRGVIGPFPCEGGADGTLIVCDGHSVQHVQRWAATDPYKLADLFHSVRVFACDNVIDNISTTATAAAASPQI